VSSTFEVASAGDPIEDVLKFSLELAPIPTCCHQLDVSASAVSEGAPAETMQSRSVARANKHLQLLGAPGARRITR
jgi:hypothetical protein